MTTTNNEDLNTMSKEKLILFQKSIALVVKKKEQIITQLQNQLQEKENEIIKLKEENKSNEEKKEEIFKVSEFTNISGISEIKIQFEKEQKNLNETIRILKQNLKKKK